MMSDISSSEPDRHSRRQRKQVFVVGTLQGSFGAATVKILNFSETGALVSGDVALVSGDVALVPEDDVVLIRDAKHIPSQVVWVRGSKAGLRFHHPISLADILSSAHSQRMPAGPAQISFRPEPAPALSRSMERSLARIWARQ